MQERRLGLEYDRNALKFLNKCENILYDRITKRLRFLRENPFPSDSKFIKGKDEKVFRLRVGDYRIFYIVDYEKNLLFIIDIKKRPKAYLREEDNSYEEDYLINSCCLCGKDTLVKVLND